MSKKNEQNVTLTRYLSVCLVADITFTIWNFRVAFDDKRTYVLPDSEQLPSPIDIKKKSGRRHDDAPFTLGGGSTNDLASDSRAALHPHAILILDALKYYNALLSIVNKYIS